MTPGGREDAPGERERGALRGEGEVRVRLCAFLLYQRKRADLGLLASLAALLASIATSRHHSLRQQRKTMTLLGFSPLLLFVFRPVSQFIHLLRFFEVFFSLV